jgi:hypothetical protein
MEGKGMPEQPKETKHQVIDFQSVRTQRLEDKRRKTERIFFQNLLGMYAVGSGEEVVPLELIEVSEEGCSFKVPFSSKNPWPKTKDDVPLRMYFSQDTYLQIRVTIKNSKPYIEEGGKYIRYGCEVDKTLSSYQAYCQFVQFLKAYSEHAHQDTGKASFFYL